PGRDHRPCRAGPRAVRTPAPPRPRTDRRSAARASWSRRARDSFSRVVDQEDPGRLAAVVAAAVAGAGGEHEALAARERGGCATVVELVLDPALDDVSPVAVRAPLVALRAGRVLDHRPARAGRSPDERPDARPLFFPAVGRKVDGTASG